MSNHNLWPINIYMNHPDLIVCIFMKIFIGLKRVINEEKLLYVCLFVCLIFDFIVYVPVNNFSVML